LEATGARSLIACPREVGAECPHCAGEIALGDPIMVCQACGTVHHRACWREHARCGAYSCVPARRAVADGTTSEPVMTITQFDLERAVPLMGSPPRPPAAQTGFSVWHPRSAAGRSDVNKLAIASLVCGLAGIPLFGIITGLVAVVLGVVALSAIKATAQRGLAVALAGVVLGIVDMTGWIILLGVLLSKPGPDVQLTELALDMSVIEGLDPALRRAMRANVVIERSGGLAALGARAIGAGVVLRIASGEALIVTNQHVVDDGFPSSSRGATGARRLARLGRVTVKMLGPAQAEGDMVWVAPGQIDLALVRCSHPAASRAQEPRWGACHRIKVGEMVFAIGNPHGLGWSHTQGVISQLRTQETESRQVQIIQTQAAINPGNSGGGLYDPEGYLVVINSWGGYKSVSEGIGFAISLADLLELAPPQLAGQVDDPKAPVEGQRP
jgi:S1-C subfamily serine protease